MKAKDENTKNFVRLTEGGASEPTDTGENVTQGKFERLKKPLIFGLMAMVFLGCMYLIFAPAKDKKRVEAGLNDSVPQATDAGLQADKKKAYEQEILEQREKEKRAALQSLADYWNPDTSQVPSQELPENTGQIADFGNAGGRPDPAVSSYRDAQNALGSFYKDDNSETKAMRKQMEELKRELAEKETGRPANTLDNQLALMEKSYQMAAKYLPGGNGAPGQAGGNAPDTAPGSSTQKEQFVPVGGSKKNAVSSLKTQNKDTAVPARRSFNTPRTPEHMAGPKNSVKACVDRTQTIEKEGDVRIRLLEAARTSTRTIPEGAVLIANAKLQGVRLELKVTSIEAGGNIIPVDITVYDVDGQQGLFVPSSAEMEAVKEMATKMGQNSGTNIMMNQNAGQQIAGDLSRTLIEGVSGYLTKKATAKKVTLKAGHQLFLVSKK